ncbi:hypothetical protein CO615_06995 [Lysobacteraceae bacterium NML75-0749]|nr:hypothetical protein CO615_06995 [Xanthomonadaceae bacterium NML75-0749]PJJ99628.1 hypothetical protein CO611_03915 [Xanthomonadaceae bacterium NML03-0222]PJK05918.1 hypothetical protein CO609_03045 [Xanthomonadaceae bacterium NML91-0268]PJK06453.1 hypothetical protein CO612_02405 [Xanthomonadaceae bacterium NML71-0210]PJK10747.1 hypothetical protein CO614_08110 [Xanthomonadaceae bacterium NML120232]
MNDADRIAELETRIAFQEHALNQLSDALADARHEIARHARLLARVVEELKSSRGAGVSIDAADEPPPPHY